MKMKKKLGKKGFSLMELLIVVSLTIALVTYIASGFSGSRDSVNTASTGLSIESIRNCVIHWQQTNNLTNYTGLTAISVLETAGCIGQITETTANKWGGSINAVVNSSNSNFWDLTFGSVPSAIEAAALTGLVTGKTSAIPTFNSGTNVWTATML